jgi:hypothetical protein
MKCIGNATTACYKGARNVLERVEEDVIDDCIEKIGCNLVLLEDCISLRTLSRRDRLN